MAMKFENRKDGIKISSTCLLLWVSIKGFGIEGDEFIYTT